MDMQELRNIVPLQAMLIKTKNIVGFINHWILEFNATWISLWFNGGIVVIIQPDSQPISTLNLNSISEIEEVIFESLEAAIIQSNSKDGFSNAEVVVSKEILEYI